MGRWSWAPALCLLLLLCKLYVRFVIVSPSAAFSLVSNTLTHSIQEPQELDFTQPHKHVLAFHVLWELCIDIVNCIFCVYCFFILYILFLLTLNLPHTQNFLHFQTTFIWFISSFLMGTKTSPHKVKMTSWDMSLQWDIWYKHCRVYQDITQKHTLSVTGIQPKTCVSSI